MECETAEAKDLWPGIGADRGRAARELGSWVNRVLARIAHSHVRIEGQGSEPRNPDDGPLPRHVLAAAGATLEWTIVVMLANHVEGNLK